jgi:hypothetical protein
MTRRKDPTPDAEADVPQPTVQPDVAEMDVAAPPESAAPESAPPEPDQPDPPTVPIPDPVPLTLAPRSEPRQSGLLGALLGGALAAIGGFALSHFDLLGLASPDQGTGLAALSASLEELQTDQTAALGALDSKIAGLADRLSTIEAAPAPAAPDLSALDALDQRLSAIEALPTNGTATSPALAAKLAQLEQRLASVAATDSSGLQEQLTAALTRLDAAEAEASAQAAEAQAAAASAQRSKALDALNAAIAEGRPFAAELDALADEALSAKLVPMAATGVPTLATLQTDFPDAAREALRIARDTNSEDGWSDRLVDFLAAQTGARPVTPLEGTTPEAILSRAEFALSEARVADALAELAPLDPAVKVPLDAWIAAATAHVTANSALAAARGE